MALIRNKKGFLGLLLIFVVAAAVIAGTAFLINEKNKNDKIREEVGSKIDTLRENIEASFESSTFQDSSLIGDLNKECAFQEGPICGKSQYVDEACPNGSESGKWAGKVCTQSESCSGRHWLESNDSERCCASGCIQRIMVDVLFANLVGENATIEKHSVVETPSMIFESFGVWLNYDTEDIPPEIFAISGSITNTEAWQVSRQIFSFEGVTKDSHNEEFRFIVINSDDSNLEISEYTSEIKEYLESGNCNDDLSSIKFLSSESGCAFNATDTGLSFKVGGESRKIVCCAVAKAEISTVGECLAAGGYGIKNTPCEIEISPNISAEGIGNTNESMRCCMKARDCPAGYAPSEELPGDASPGFFCESSGNKSFYSFEDTQAGPGNLCAASCIDYGCDSESGKCNTGFCCLRWKDLDGNSIPDNETEKENLVKSPILNKFGCGVDDPEEYDRAVAYNAPCSTADINEILSQEEQTRYIDCAAISDQRTCYEQVGYCTPVFTFFGTFYAGCVSCPVHCNDFIYWAGHGSTSVAPKTFCECKPSETNCRSFEDEQSCANSGQGCVPWYSGKKLDYNGCGSCPVTCKMSDYSFDWIREIDPCNCVDESADQEQQGNETVVD